jgi:hypothetical protein
VVDSVLILLRAPGLMSVGFGLAAIRASRERGHRDGRWQARRLHLFQPRLRGGRRRFPGGGRPPTPGPPCSVSRRQHRTVGAPQSGHPQRLVGSSCFSMSRRPCWLGGRLPSPSSKRTSTTVRVSVPIRFSERPPGLRRIFSPFTRPLSDFACMLYLCGIVAYCILYLCGIVAYRG